jgi:hypothetical protein
LMFEWTALEEALQKLSGPIELLRRSAPICFLFYDKI